MSVSKIKAKTIAISFTILAVFVIDSIVLFGLYSLFDSRAQHYEALADNSTDNLQKALSMEKSLLLIPRESKSLKLADIYIKIGDYGKASKSISKINTVSSYNKLGGINLLQDKPEEAVLFFYKALALKDNSVSLGGLYEAHLLKGESEKAYDVALKLSRYDNLGGKCREIYAQLYVNPQQPFDYPAVSNCNVYNLKDFSLAHNKYQSPLFLKLSAINLYYNAGFTELAKRNILLLQKDNNDYRDAHILAHEILRSTGDDVEAEAQKQKALALDPLAFSE